MTDSIIAWYDDVHRLIIEHPSSNFLNKPDTPVRITERSTNTHYYNANINHSDEKEIIVELDNPLPIGRDLVLVWDELEIPIYTRKITRTKWFEDNFFTNRKLGAFCNNKSTSFSIWSPVATAVHLQIKNNFYLLDRNQDGSWSISLDGDFHRTTYIYQITINGFTQEVIDPYAKSVTANSTEGVIIDLNRTNALNHQRPNKITKFQDAIIYELHLRDLSTHENSGINNKGNYLGLTESNTVTNLGYSTGRCYINELGITHVQLLPVNDFARVDDLHPNNSYNWGYDPLFFQAPEGSYSSNPTNPLSRINELKSCIDSCHEDNLSVILDVVYNHVFQIDHSSFEKMVPGYFFRYHDNGELSNGTGVGNDFASEKLMARKFILDTIDYFLNEYNVDGFRFDLMGAIDVTTMQEIQKRCQKEKEFILLLGEGWNLPTALPANQKSTPNQAHELTGIAFFNDFFRDTLKGNLFAADSKGYVNGEGMHVEHLPHLVTGCVLSKYGIPFAENPGQIVNYVECHDNHTLWDRLSITNSHFTVDERKKTHQLATAITILSQGIPFLHAGQEWYRTKHGDENSYQSGDNINQLNWSQRETEEESITFVRTLIELRKRYPVFRLPSVEDINNYVHILPTIHPVFGYTLLDNDADITIYINPTNTCYDLQLPSSANWKVAVSNEFIKRNEQVVIGEQTTLHPYEILVLVKQRSHQKAKNHTIKSYVSQEKGQ